MPAERDVNQPRSINSQPSTISSLYESSRALDEYLLFHYGSPEDLMPWEFGPAGALDFPVRTVTELAGAEPHQRALDLGCAVGRSTFELSRFCNEVTGIDFSRQFIEAAETLRTIGRIEYSCLVEGNERVSRVAVRPAGVYPERVRFEHGDAMDLPANYDGGFDLVHAANLLCRLPDPARCLDRLPALVRPGGTLILITPCTWLEEFTPPERWPQGSTAAWLENALTPHFDFILRKDLPFLIREHARKFQWSVALATAWRRRV